MSRFHRENPDQPIQHDCFEGVPLTWNMVADALSEQAGNEAHQDFIVEQPLTIEVQIPLIGPNFQPGLWTVLKAE